MFFFAPLFEYFFIVCLSLVYALKIYSLKRLAMISPLFEIGFLLQLWIKLHFAVNLKMKILTELSKKSKVIVQKLNIKNKIFKYLALNKKIPNCSILVQKSVTDSIKLRD